MISKPNGEQWLGKRLDNTFDNYQLAEYNKAIEHTARFRVGIDIGANLGIMSSRMVKQFDRVIAFEPLFHKHLAENVKAMNLTIYPFAVGDQEKIVTMRVGIYHSGGSNIVNNKVSNQTYRDVEVVTLDSYNFEDVDFIKIDVEDYEMFVLYGARATIEKYKPTILIELKKTNPHYENIIAFFDQMGYVREIVGELDSVFYQPRG